MELNFNEVLQTIIYATITVGLPIILKKVSDYLKAQKDEKLLNIKNQKIREVLSDSLNVIFNVVDTVSQTYVDDLKKVGKFDISEQKFALEKAIEQTKNILSDEATEVIEDSYNDLDEWIRTSIEAYIKETK